MFRLATTLAWQGLLFQVTFVLLFMVEDGFTCKASPLEPALYRKGLPQIISFPDPSDSKQQEVKPTTYMIIYKNQLHIFHYHIFAGKTRRFDRENRKRHQDHTRKQPSPPPDSLPDSTKGARFI